MNTPPIKPGTIHPGGNIGNRLRPPASSVTAAQNSGVVGQADNLLGAGVFGENKRGIGVLGISDGGEAGVYGYGGDPEGVGIHGKGGRLAGLFEGNGQFEGNVDISGTLTVQGNNIISSILAAEGLTGRIAPLDSRISTLETQVTILQELVSELQNQIKYQETQIVFLQKHHGQPASPDL